MVDICVGRRWYLKDFSSTRFANPGVTLDAGVALIRAAAEQLQGVKCHTAYDLYGEPMNLIRRIAYAVDKVLPHQRQTTLRVAGQTYEIERVELPVVKA